MDPQGTTSERQNQITVSVTYKGVTKNLGVWDTWDGAGVTADNTKHRRGGMGQQVAVGGPATIDDLTIGRDYDLKRDNPNAHFLANSVGGAQVVAKKTYLDANGFAFGDPIVITGVLIGYTEPPGDSDSGDISMVEIVINPDGVVG
jgi:hypothetical protein